MRVDAARLAPDVAEFTVGRAFGAIRWLIRATLAKNVTAGRLALAGGTFMVGD